MRSILLIADSRLLSAPTMPVGVDRTFGAFCLFVCLFVVCPQHNSTRRMAIANGMCISFCTFCSSWDNRGNFFCTDGKKIQFWSNASQHVSIYLQPFTSYSEILVGNCNFFLPFACNAPFGVFPLEFRGKVWSPEN